MRSRPVIVVAEDDPAICKFLVDALPDELGAHVLAAHDGQRLLELVRQVRPALVITDLLMPRMDGLEVARRLHDDPETAGIPILIISALAAHKAAIEAGGWLFVPKPFELDNLLQAVADLLALRSHQPAHA